MATHMDQFAQIVAHGLRAGILQSICEYANENKHRNIAEDDLIQHLCIPCAHAGGRIASLPRALTEIPPTTAPSTKGRRKKTPTSPPPEIPKPPPGHCQWFFRTGGAEKKNTYCGKQTDGGCIFCKDCVKKDNAKRQLESMGMTVPVPPAKGTVQTLAVQPEGPPVLRVTTYDKDRGLYIDTNTRLVVYENDKSELFYIGKDQDGNIVPLDDRDRELAALLEIREAPVADGQDSPDLSPVPVGVPIPVPAPAPVPVLAPVPVPGPIGVGAARTLGARGPMMPTLNRPAIPTLPPMPRLA